MKVIEISYTIRNEFENCIHDPKINCNSVIECNQWTAIK